MVFGAHPVLTQISVVILLLSAGKSDFIYFYTLAEQNNSTVFLIT